MRFLYGREKLNKLNIIINKLNIIIYNFEINKIIIQIVQTNFQLRIFLSGPNYYNMFLKNYLTIKQYYLVRLDNAL